MPYAGDVVGFLDNGVTDHDPTIAELVERPFDKRFYYQLAGGGQTVFSWVNLFGTKTGDQLDYFFYEPDGSEYAHFNWTLPEIHYGWHKAGIVLPGVPDTGIWTIVARRNGDIFYVDGFQVILPEPNSLLVVLVTIAVLISTFFYRQREAAKGGGVQWTR